MKKSIDKNNCNFYNNSKDTETRKVTVIPSNNPKSGDI